MKPDEKKLSLGVNDIPSYALETIKPEYGAGYFYLDKLMKITNVKYSNNEYIISYKVINEESGNFTEVKRYPNFEQVGEFELNF